MRQRGNFLFSELQSISIRNSEFYNNEAFRGSAINLFSNSKLEVYNCYFENNYVFDNGGAI